MSGAGGWTVDCEVTLNQFSMDDDTLEATITKILKNDVFVDIIREQVKLAVDSAVAERDAEIELLREELTETKAQLNSLEQYSRRLCLDVSGIPETSGEDTDRLVIDTAKLAGVHISKDDIDRSHRVGAVKEGKTRTLVVRFAAYTKREAFYDARRKLRKPEEFEGSTVTAEVAKKTFVTDNLTRENHHILYQARQYRKEGKIYAAWSDVGKLKVRVREDSRTTVIRTLADLHKLVGGPAASREPPATATTSDDGSRRSARAAAAAKPTKRGKK